MPVARTIEVGDIIHLHGVNRYHIDITGNFIVTSPSSQRCITFDETNKRIEIRGLFMAPVGLARAARITSLVSSPHHWWHRMWLAVARFALRRLP